MFMKRLVRSASAAANSATQAVGFLFFALIVVLVWPLTSLSAHIVCADLFLLMVQAAILAVWEGSIARDAYDLLTWRFEIGICSLWLLLLALDNTPSRTASREALHMWVCCLALWPVVLPVISTAYWQHWFLLPLCCWLLCLLWWHSWEKLALLAEENPQRLEHGLGGSKYLVKRAVQKHPEALLYASKKVQYDEEVIMEAVQCHLKALHYAPNKFKSNHDVVMTAVGANGLALQHASKELKNNHEVVKRAALRDGNALSYASNELKNDYELVMAVVGENPLALQHASNQLKNNYNVVKRAALRDGNALSYASNELKNNYELVMALVRKSPLALQHASNELKNSDKVVEKAAHSDWNALSYASNKLKSNTEFMMHQVCRYWPSLKYASEELKSNYEFVMAAVSENGLALQFASEELKSNHDIAIAAVSTTGCALEFVSQEMASIHEIVMAAVSQDGLSLQNAPEECRDNTEIVMKAISQDWRAHRYASKALGRGLGDYDGRAPLVALHVVLMSGRCIPRLFTVKTSIEDVLSEYANVLGVDPSIAEKATLLSGTSAIRSLRSLESWEHHELTLVLP